MNKNKVAFLSRKWWQSVFLLTVLFSLSSLQSAMGLSIIASDCNLDFKNVFFDNEPVCAFGDSPGGSIFGAPALACVVPPGSTSTGDDVTAGGCNAVPILASLWEEFLWLPPTVPGNYTLIIVNNQGSFATDSITILSSGGAAPTVDVAAIKAAAGAAANTWQATQLWGEYLDEFHSAISISWAAATGDVVGVVVGVVGALSGQPTDYNSWVVQQGGQIIAALAGQQAAKYASLEADPPDPLFTDFVSLDISAINTDLALLAPLKPLVALQYPFANQSQDSLHLVSTKLANSLAEESALVFTLMRTLEKFQGAEAAANDEFTLLQARALKKYADQLGTQLTSTRQGALDYKAELAADGLDAIVYDGAEVAALFDRLTASGLTPAEEQGLRDVGFTDADILLMFDRIDAFPAPPGMYSRGGGLDDIVTSIDGMLVAVQDLGTQAQEVVDHFAPLVTVQHPSADAGGPYNDNEGVLINFDGSGSSDPQAQVLTYEWDFDLDGQFDDAAGASVSNTYNSPIVTQVGLRVTDTDGNVDIAYATVIIAEVNGPPEITSFVPVDLVPTASNLSPLDFSATASDPDFEALSFEWLLNGAVISTAASWTYTPGVGEAGTSTVRLTVSDLNPLSEDAFETRLVALIEETLVPDVTGQAQATAEGNIVAADLTVGTVSSANSDTVAVGNVISQNPLAGSKVLVNSAVDLVLSLGQALIAVPDVVGDTQANAEAAIVAAGLAVGTVNTASSDTVPAGNVISQNPVAGSNVAAGSAVDLVISLGQALLAVPDVIGDTQANAEATIVAAGLAVGTVNTASSDTVPAGNVISQNPVAGSNVAAGSAVDLVVSLGQALIAVPDVVGDSQANAEAAIVAAGLAVGTVSTANSDTVPAGNVISQNPVAGSNVAAGSAVDLVVSLGQALIAVPDVIGNTQVNAEAVIVAAELTVGTIFTANSDTVPVGNVVNQNPAAGNNVAAGSAVDLLVSLGAAGEPPAAPENMRWRAKLLHVGIAWSGSDTAAGFRVFRRLDSEPGFSQIAQTENRFYIDDLPEGTQAAKYAVQAVNAFGKSGPSDIVTVVPGSR